MRRSALMGSAATLLASFALGAGVTGVSAQDADTEEFTVEEVVVTGSRIVRKDFSSASPISVTSSADVKLSGFTRIEDLMNSLPQVEAAQTAFISNGASGTASIDLRGMGTNRTLVLVNGRRLQPGGVYSNAPDVNQIPAALVDRVEVITGGASATYGADAVAGVVNYVMDTDFEGIEITAGIGGYQHNNNNDYIQGLMDDAGFVYPSGSSGIGGKSYNIDMTMGGDFDGGKGHATIYATWRKDEEMLQGERDYSSCALNGTGTGCGGSGNAVVPNFYIGGVTADGAFDWGNYDYWTLDSNGFIPSVGNVYNYAPVNHFIRPDERWTLGAFVNYEINDHFKPYLEVAYMRDRTAAQIAESGTFFAETYLLDYDTPLISDTQRQQLTDAFGLVSGDQFATYIGKRNVEGGPRASNLEHHSFRIVTGTEGEIGGGWTYNASFQYGSTSSSAAYINDFFAPRIKEAVEGVYDDGSGNAVCDGATTACIPYEVFTLNGITPEAAGNLTGVGILNGITKEYIANAYVTGDLGITLPSASDAIQTVFGVEYRKEVFQRVSDEVFQNGLLLGQGGPTVSVAGDYNVKEVFAEAMVPLVQDAEFAQDLTLELAGRLSDYNTSGSAETYKVALSWTPTDMVTFNASYNRAVRAPNVVELFIPQNQGLWGGTDPCAGANPTYTAAQCANTGVTAAQYGSIVASPASQYNGLFGGNPDLSPEIADTWSFGTVLRPTDDLVVRVDYWDIKLQDVISTASPSEVLDECALSGTAAFCDLINRSGGGSLWLGTAGYVTLTNQNLGARRWKGLDVLADYSTEVGSGMISAKLEGTYMLKKEVTEIVGVSTAYDCAGTVSGSCYPQPDWRHSLRVTYESDSFWSVSAKWRYFGSVENTDLADNNDAVVGEAISAQSYFDLKGAFEINENTSMLVGVNNVFDKEPPLVGGSLLGTAGNANTFAGFYDTLGRYLHASVTFSF